jgi:hypothetical protein
MCDLSFYLMLVHFARSIMIASYFFALDSAWYRYFITELLCLNMQPYSLFSRPFVVHFLARVLVIAYQLPLLVALSFRLIS